MSCCGGDCRCGAGCGCGSGCCKYPDVEKDTTTTAVKIEGVAPVMNTVTDGSAEKSSGAEGGHACHCTPKCTCNPCNC